MGSTSMCAKAEKEAAAFPSHSLEYARRITNLPLLVRMDAGNDALENFECLPERRGGFHHQTQPAPGVAGRMADDRQERRDVL